MTDGTIEPGWYQDPSGGCQRWWDGAQWTAHTRPVPTGQPEASTTSQPPPQDPQQDPAQGPSGVAAEPTAATYGASGHQATTAVAGGQAAASGRNRGVFVAVIAAVVVVLVGVGAALWFWTSLGDDADQAASEGPSETGRAGDVEEASPTEQGPDDGASSESSGTADTGEEGPAGEPSGSDLGPRVEPVPWASFQEPGGPWDYEVMSPEGLLGTWNDVGYLELFTPPDLATIDEALVELEDDAERFGGRYLDGPNERPVENTDRAVEVYLEDEEGRFAVGFLLMEIDDALLIFGISDEGGGPTVTQMEGTFESFELDRDAFFAASGS